MIDTTGAELSPGEQGFECCCDECDYYLLCFPEFYQKREKEVCNDTPPLNI